MYKRQVREYNGVKPVFFGLNSERDVYADQVESKGLKGVACRIHLGEDAFDVLVPTPGIHMVYNALAAAAVGRIYGLTIEEIRSCLLYTSFPEAYLPPDSRFFHLLLQ